MIVLFAAAAMAHAPLAPSEIKACLGVEEAYADWAAIAQAKASLPADAWKDACRQARDANARRLSVTKAIRETGVSPLKAFERSAQWIVKANTASDPDVARLFRLAFEAELPRVSGSRSRTPITAGLSPTALALYDSLAAVDGVAADATNREWLGETVARKGWFTIDRYGGDADRAAWLIVQHSDADLAFKRRMITLIEPLTLTGQSRKEAFPSMYDRWAAAAHEPQRFGLQGSCKSKGVWEPLPIEDPEHIDERRRKFGIEKSFADEVKANGARCP
ncbi:DUF6624 domain-containing protein [uncultured Caulobacter sp.]|uniref:DUF6624 domain-containing protein n=1 Tax=uncultured Caulobacter sp. TaxID=158749 RepID=UPI0026396A25|nr:DUF6624 domain-containing protein [uncultured Caulobacter sp.]